MFSKSNQKKSGTAASKNPLETFKDFDQLLGQFSHEDDDNDTEKLGKANEATKEKKQVGTRKEFSIFNYQEYYESKIIKDQIKQLTESIKREVALVKKADKSLMGEINDISKLTLDSLPEKTGIYHVRFLEIILSLLQTIRAKIGESRTWLTAMVSKKKKRGSLFASLSKKKGTQYSLSQEMSSARSIQ